MRHLAPWKIFAISSDVDLRLSALAALSIANKSSTFVQGFAISNGAKQLAATVDSSIRFDCRFLPGSNF